MRNAPVSWLALTGLILINLPATGFGQRPGSPAWVAHPETLDLAASASVDRAVESLLERTLAAEGAPGLIEAMRRVREDERLTLPERDAVLHGYLERLRAFPPGTVPEPVLNWLAKAPPLAVTGHEEGPHHAVAVFNVAATARGLANEWSWRSGREAVARATPGALPKLARELGRSDPDSPRLAGMRFAIARLPAERLEALARACAVTADGCGAARADIELARDNVDWLQSWIRQAAASEVAPRLRPIRERLARSRADRVMRAALEHPDPGVAARALSDITSSLPKDRARRMDWGSRLVNLLDDPELGGAAALQLARMDSADWIEAATSRPLGKNARRRLELLAEMEGALRSYEADSEVRR